MARPQQCRWKKKSNKTNRSARKRDNKANVNEELEHEDSDEGINEEEEPSQKKVRWEARQDEGHADEQEGTTNEDADSSIQVAYDKVRSLTHLPFIA